MPRITFATVVKLVLASMMVGAVLAFLDVQPVAIWRWLADKVGDIAANIQHYAGRAVTWFLLGAVVVVPLWLLLFLWKALRGKV